MQGESVNFGPKRKAEIELFQHASLQTTQFGLNLITSL